MPNSAVDPKFQYSDTVWVVSNINTGSKLAGHSVIVVEGIKKTQEDNNNNNIFAETFVGQYDIKCKEYVVQSKSINLQGYIHRVDIHEAKTATREYKQYSHRSYCVTPEKAQEMISAIKEDRQKVDRLKQMIEEGKILEGNIDAQFIKKNGFLEYQLAGKSPFLADEGAGDNCASWTANKLKIAGIGDGSKKKPEPGPCLVM